MVPFGLSTIVASRRFGTAAATPWPARGYWSVVTFSCPLRRRRHRDRGRPHLVRTCPDEQHRPRIRSAGISRNGSSQPCSVPRRPGADEARVHDRARHVRDDAVDELRVNGAEKSARARHPASSRSPRPCAARLPAAAPASAPRFQADAVSRGAPHDLGVAVQSGHAHVQRRVDQPVMRRGDESHIGVSAARGRDRARGECEDAGATISRR
jgi:hypothetical protein